MLGFFEQKQWLNKKVVEDLPIISNWSNPQPFLCEECDPKVVDH